MRIKLHLLCRQLIEYFSTALSIIFPRISSQFHFSPVYDFWSFTNICIFRSSSTYKPLADRPNKVIVHLFWKQKKHFFLFVCLLKKPRIVLIAIKSAYWILWDLSCKTKLAKAREMRKPPGTLGLKKFGPGKIWVENVSIQNTCILDDSNMSLLHLEAPKYFLRHLFASTFV